VLTKPQKESILSMFETALALPGYQIVSAVGRGAMGSVYKATDRKGGLVAIKILSPVWARDPVHTKNFLAEAQTIQKLSHPNIVKLIDAGEDAGTYFIVMEFVEGPSFARAIARRAFLHREIGFILAAIGRALQHAHQMGVIHSDITPRNILLKSDGSPKLVDFGTARLLTGGLPQVRGQTAGTPLYMSPEQASGIPDLVDHRTDVYSLGTVLYEAATGRVPFSGFGVREILEKVQKIVPPAPRLVDPQIPPELERIIVKAMDKNPARRYPAMKEFADELQAWANSAPDWYSMVPHG
jgi:serine/threonine-protein kinase